MQPVMRSALGYLWRAPLAMVAYVVGTILGGALLLPALGLPAPAIPGHADPKTVAGLMALAAIVLAASLGPLARGLQGGLGVRWAVLALLTYVCLGVNTAIEAAAFTRYGGTAGLLVMAVPGCLLLAAAMALTFGPGPHRGVPADQCVGFWAARPLSQWAWRLPVAIAAFPAVYFFFGTPVGFLVADYYRQEGSGMVLPSLGTVVATQFLRGTLFLAGLLPVVILWTGPRQRMFLALGWAFFVLTGAFGMIQAYWLPASIRAIHTVEFLADALAYVGAVTALLAVTPAPAPTASPSPALVEAHR